MSPGPRQRLAHRPCRRPAPGRCRPVDPAARRAQAGTSVHEIMLVAVLVGLFAMPLATRARLAEEQVKVDRAASVLHAVWVAQRMYLREHGVFAPSLADLAAEDFLAPQIATLSEPFGYAVVAADDEGFLAEAVRAGSSTWSGTLLVDEWGVVTGTIGDGEGHDVGALELL